MPLHDQVFGWPLMPDGSHGERCDSTLDAVRRLQQQGGVCSRAVLGTARRGSSWGHLVSCPQVDAPVVLWDERYSSREARERVHDRGARKRPGTVNQVAAEIILQVRMVQWRWRAHAHAELMRHVLGA